MRFSSVMARQSIFLETFGDPPLLRVLDFLIIHEEFDYSLTDIAMLSGVSYSTIKTLWKGLEKHHIILLTRRVGKAKMYRLDNTNPTVTKLKEFYWATVKNTARKRTLATIRR
jgi:DNA-binding transcriptional ArsR family regulator